MVRSFDAVVFDMDGVLCDTEPFIAAATIEALRRRYGIEVAHADLLPFVGAGDDAYIAGAAASQGVVADLAIDKPLTYEIYLAQVRASLRPSDGVLEFLRELRAAGIPLAVATGSDVPKLEGNLAAIGVPAGTFDVVVTAEQVRRKKPDPETFLRAIEGLGLSPGRCLVVEDSPNGIRAGRAAGCRVLGITSSQPAGALLAAGAETTAAGLGQVPATVRAALGLVPEPAAAPPG